MHETLFSSKEFVEAWSQSCGNDHLPLAVPVVGSGPPRTMYCIQRLGSYGLRSISLGPMGLYGSPGWDGQLETATVKRILAFVRDLRTRSLVWNVRFDQETLAVGLAFLGLKYQRTPTHIIPLSDGYERIFSRFNATMRNHVRRARRAGVAVREGRDSKDIYAYYAMHLGLAKTKNYNCVYPVDLFLNLMKMKAAVRFLVAEWEGKLISGGFFFRDGASSFYWHGASDREYSRFYPACAVLDEAIKWGCENGSRFFNMGGSGGIGALESFKMSWGAQLEHNWMFQWTSPTWKKVAECESLLRRGLSHFKRRLG